ncbi:MAG: biotin transporter BioY, partial [Saprospiraceae bacterium]|nr:biotin transporter BioY [Saprospiraceae bacterium]
TSGWSKLSGPSGGFLWGFLISGLIISLLQRPQFGFSRLLGLMLFATIVLFICGLGQLTTTFGFEKAIEYGFTPFWKMALLKAFFAAGVVFFANSILNRYKKDRS